MIRPGVEKKSKDIVPLTSIRGVAAIWVVVFHMYDLLVFRQLIKPSTAIVQNLLLGGSNFAVDIFFILSGYILAENYGTISNSGVFFSHRVARVLPLHIVVLCAMAAGIWAMSKVGIYPESQEFFSWSAFPYHLLLISVWFGMIGWNVPTWSLNAESAAYLTFPGLQWLARRLTAPTLFGLGVLLLAADFNLVEVGGYKATGFAAIARGLFGFGGGAMLRFAGSAKYVRAWTAPACVALTTVIACFNAYPFAIFPAAALIVVLDSPENGIVHRVLSWPFLEWLGRISYSIYLVHTGSLIVTMQILRKTFVQPSGLELIVWVIAYLGVTLLLSELAWRFVEMPARRAIRGGWRRFEERWAQ